MENLYTKKKVRPTAPVNRVIQENLKKEADKLKKEIQVVQIKALKEVYEVSSCVSA